MDRGRSAQTHSPLSKAVFYSHGRGELIHLLRGAGADPRHENRHGVSPLALALTIPDLLPSTSTLHVVGE
jgi:ankyrin repeat protein